MQVSVRLSAALAQVTGAARLQLEVSDGATGATVAAVRQALAGAYPALAARLAHAVPIIDGNHAAPEDAVAPGQEVAFLMPVAGGCQR